MGRCVMSAELEYLYSTLRDLKSRFSALYDELVDSYSEMKEFDSLYMSNDVSVFFAFDSFIQKLYDKYSDERFLTLLSLHNSINSLLVEIHELSS